jgi:hypothetical protein
MPTQPSEILALAGRIRDANPTESGRRSAASRAYYAALLRTRDQIGMAPRLPKGEPDSTHDRIIRAAAQQGSGNGRSADACAKIAGALSRMRTDRNRADYELAKGFSEADCRDMFIRAHAVMRHLDSLSDVAPSGAGVSPATAKTPETGPAAATSAPGATPAPSDPPKPPNGPRPALKRIR